MCCLVGKFWLVPLSELFSYVSYNNSEKMKA
jgi:hypothetical protein